MDETAVARLVAAVQRNCDLADAHHAREKSLCTYLLGMREFFRWSEHLPLGASLDKGDLRRWITERERGWDERREKDNAEFESLPVNGGLDPFDEAGANQRLAAHGLVYGAGIGLFGAPTFFLGTRQSEEYRSGATLLVADRELARGMTAAPATSRGGTIIVRVDALRRWLWTRAEAAQRNDRERTFATVLDAYDVGDGTAVAVERMARGEVETLVLHELGELRAGQLLGGQWESMLEAVGDPRTELTLRAVRDLLADCLVTLPELMAREARASLLFWFATFDGLRRALAPDLAGAYCNESSRVDVSALQKSVQSGREYWLAAADDLCSLWRTGGRTAVVEAARQLSAMH